MKSSPQVSRGGDRAREMGTHLLYHSSICLSLREFPLECIIHFLGLELQGGHCLLQGKDAVSRLVGFLLQPGNLLVLCLGKGTFRGQNTTKIILGAH